MTDRVAIVTGGSGGIGSAIATRLAREGAAVCIGYLHDEERARAVVEQLRSNGGRAMAVRADVGREHDVVALFETADRELGTLSWLVNNAAVLGDERRIEDVEGASLAALWATNVTGCVLCAREAIRRMSLRHGGGGGAIVNVSSMSGVRGGSEQRVAYGASKGAINAFTLGLGRELALDGIRVNAVVPGYVDTAVHAAPERRERLERAVQAVPMRRAARPDEVAEAVLWLLSDKASFVTATLLPVAGGA